MNKEAHRRCKERQGLKKEVRSLIAGELKASMTLEAQQVNLKIYHHGDTELVENFSEIGKT